MPGRGVICAPEVRLSPSALVPLSAHDSLSPESTHSAQRSAHHTHLQPGARVRGRGAPPSSSQRERACATLLSRGEPQQRRHRTPYPQARSYTSHPALAPGVAAVPPFVCLAAQAQSVAVVGRGGRVALIGAREAGDDRKFLQLQPFSKGSVWRCHVAADGPVVTLR